MWYNLFTSEEVLLLCPFVGRTSDITLLEGGKKSLYLPGGAIMRVKVTLVCEECKQRNYDTTKNKKTNPDRIELKKYCKFCRKHTNHKESK